MDLKKFDLWENNQMKKIFPKKRKEKIFFHVLVWGESYSARRNFFKKKENFQSHAYEAKKKKLIIDYLICFFFFL